MRVFVAGHNGLVGSAIMRNLNLEGNYEIINRSSQELDLRDQQSVQQFINHEKPDCIFVAAAKVGGIMANSTLPVAFLLDNLKIQNNLIEAAHLADINKIIFLGSSCIYPNNLDRPITETDLLTSSLEPTNEPYAIAKIAGIKLCAAYRRQYQRDFRCVMPCNLYGPNDNFSGYNSHVIPALIKKFHTAKIQNEQTVEIWGSGKPRREFLHADDLADAINTVFKLTAKEYDGLVEYGYEFINVGAGIDITIQELATGISNIVGFDGSLEFNLSKPDGTMRKILDNSKIASIGWSPQINITQGLSDTYQWYLNSVRDSASGV